MTKAKKLTPRQELFVFHYVAEPNGTAAAVAAGYAERSAKVTASRLLTNANVQKKISALQKRAEAKLELSRERLVHEVARLAFSDVTSCFQQEEDGPITIKALKDMPEDARAALSELTIEADGRIKLKMHAKKPAQELLAKLLGYFSDPEQGRDRTIQIPNDASVVVIGGDTQEFVLACRRARGEEP